MKILEVQSESLCVCRTNVGSSTQGTHTDHGIDIATKQGTRVDGEGEYSKGKKQGKEPVQRDYKCPETDRRDLQTKKEMKAWDVDRTERKRYRKKKARPEMKW